MLKKLGRSAVSEAGMRSEHVAVVPAHVVPDSGGVATDSASQWCLIRRWEGRWATGGRY